jgi:CRP/FNR family transcriptional regulator, cyclic AMP receptor protein
MPLDLQNHYDRRVLVYKTFACPTISALFSLRPSLVRPDRPDSPTDDPALTAIASATALERSAWFRGLPDALRTALRASGRVRTVRAGERLFMRGDPDDGVYCVLEGAVRVGAASMGGREALLAVVGPTNWFGEITLFDGGPRTHDAYAERDSILFHVPRRALAALLDATPAWWHAFGLLLTQKLRLAFEAIEEAALLPAAARVARRLLVLAHSFGDEPGGQGEAHRVVSVPQEDLALMLALSRQTVNQILRQFEREGLVVLRYGQIEIADAARLDLAAQGPMVSDQ